MKDEEGYYWELYNSKVEELSLTQKKLFDSICAWEALEMQV